jgi:class 3 adenylate cyclase
MKVAARDYIEANEVVAIFEMAPFTNFRARVETRELLDLLENYFKVMFRLVELSGGTPRHDDANGVVGLWKGEMTAQAKENFGKAIVEALIGIEALTLPGGIHCVPAIGVAFGPVVHASLTVAGNKLRFEGGPAMNLARRLSSACAVMKKKVLFPASLPVLWPPEMTTEDLGPITIQGNAEQMQLMSLHEKGG